MLRSRIRSVVLIAALASLPPLAAGARAQAPEPVAAPTAPAGIDLSVGGGLLETPLYPGARRKELSPFPYLNGTIGPDVQLDSLDGIRVTALRFGEFSAGLAARYRGGWPSRSLPARLRGLGGVADAAELGGFATVEAGPFALDVVGTQDVVRGRRGTSVEAHATVSVPFGDPAERQGVEFGPFLKGANRTLNRKNFGVSPAQAAATGLAAFAPDAGPTQAGLEVNGALALTGRWSVRSFANWGRLVGDAAKAPLVREGGSRDQLSSGLFLVFTP